MFGTKPYTELKYREIKGRRMAYIDEGKGDAIVFQHGLQPAPSLNGLDTKAKCATQDSASVF
jgi:hypothetical protein